MACDKGGRYDSRSRREGCWVVREHVGGGEVAKMAAQLGAIERDKQLTDRDCYRIDRERAETLTRP